MLKLVPQDNRENVPGKEKMCVSQLQGVAIGNIQFALKYARVYMYGAHNVMALATIFFIPGLNEMPSLDVALMKSQQR
jgi:hypothetical protein